MSTQVEVNIKNCSVIEARIVNSRSEPTGAAYFSPNQKIYHLGHGYSMSLTLGVSGEEKEYLIFDMERSKDGRYPNQAKIKLPNQIIRCVRQIDGEQSIDHLFTVRHKVDS